MTRLAVEFEWRRIGWVTSETGVDGVPELRFPEELTSRPGVYRLLFVGHGPAEVYIGESDDVRRRARQYRRGDGTQKTSRWVHEHLRNRLHEGVSVAMELMTSARHAVDDGPWRDTVMARKEHRLILENAALAIAIAATADPTGEPPAMVLNRVAGPHA